MTVTAPFASGRFWEIDALRGLAVIAMIAFHSLFDLSFFQHVPGIDVGSGFLWWAARAIAATFILLSGISLSISFRRSVAAGVDPVRKFFIRSANLFALALLITLATFVFLNGRGTIVFGILHFMAVASLFTLPFHRHPKASAVAGVFCIAIGFILSGITVGSPNLFWLGLPSPGFYTLDFFPLFPWMGVMFLGVSAGNALYSPKGRLFSPGISQLQAVNHWLSRALTFIGRNSLLIYFLHQPFIIGLILLLGK